MDASPKKPPVTLGKSTVSAHAEQHRAKRGRSTPAPSRQPRRSPTAVTDVRRRHPLAVRNPRSALQDAGAPVARDVSCRISYSRSIFLTNTAISYVRAGPSRARATERAAQLRVVDQLDRPRAPAPPASRLGTISASCPIGEDVEQAVGIGRDDRLARRQRFERGQRRAFPERRKHDDVERRQHRGDVALEADEHQSIAEIERGACAFELACCSSPSPMMNTRARGCSADNLGHRLDQILVALRRHQPRHRADGDRVGRRCRARRGPRQSRRPMRGRANSSSGDPEIDHLGPLGRHQPRADRELGRRLRDRDRQVGVRRQHPIGDLLKPRRVGVVRVLVQNRGNPSRQAHSRPNVVAP